MTAVPAGEALVPASELAAARAELAELQRALGKKTLENEILKEAVEYAAEKKWIPRSARCRSGQRLLMVATMADISLGTDAGQQLVRQQVAVHNKVVNWHWSLALVCEVRARILSSTMLRTKTSQRDI